MRGAYRGGYRNFNGKAAEDHKEIGPLQIGMLQESKLPSGRY